MLLGVITPSPAQRCAPDNISIIIEIATIYWSICKTSKSMMVWIIVNLCYFKSLSEMEYMYEISLFIRHNTTVFVIFEYLL